MASMAVFADPSFAKHIQMALTGDDSWDVRQAACEALCELRGQDSLPAVATALEDPDEHVQKTALRCRQSMGKPGLEELAKQKTHPLASIRSAAQETALELRYYKPRQFPTDRQENEQGEPIDEAIARLVSAIERERNYSIRNDAGVQLAAARSQSSREARREAFAKMLSNSS